MNSTTRPLTAPTTGPRKDSEKATRREELNEKHNALQKQLTTEREEMSALIAKHRMALERKTRLMQEAHDWETAEGQYSSFKSTDRPLWSACELGEKWGNLNFATHQAWDTTPVMKGRSSRRTQLYHDITGTLHFGPNEKDQKRRLIGKKNLDDAATTLSSSAARTWVTSNMKAREGARILGHGKPTLPDLSTLKHRSSRRTRWYTDYEGKRIMVDACDFPEHFRCFGR